jgi:predicted HicB family RNase H-like nuclease
VSEREPIVLVMSPRRRGRPREFGSLISVRVPTELHDRLCIEANRRRIDVADVIRERLQRNSVSQK